MADSTRILSLAAAGLILAAWIVVTTVPAAARDRALGHGPRPPANPLTPQAGTIVSAGLFGAEFTQIPAQLGPATVGSGSGLVARNLPTGGSPIPLGPTGQPGESLLIIIPAGNHLARGSNLGAQRRAGSQSAGNLRKAWRKWGATFFQTGIPLFFPPLGAREWRPLWGT